MFGNIYANKKVFITGHTGFKGSWLTAWALSLGAKVTGYSLEAPTDPSAFEAMRLRDKITDIRGDVRDKGAFAAAVGESAPDIIFHLAAQALVRPSYDDPVHTFETNVMGVVNALEAARHAPGLRAVVIITSDKCYRNAEWIWGYRETDRLGGYDPYSASKGCAEIAAHSYFESFFCSGPACATARAGNVIGGGDWAKDRVVPDCARAWAEKKPVEIRNPRATRPWQLVLEPLSGYLWLGARLMDNESRGSTPYNPRSQSYNFGPPAEVIHTVADVARALSKYWPGSVGEAAKWNDASKKESGLLKLCCDKALAELDWTATLNFEETIRFTAEWYAAYYAGNEDMNAVTRAQIAAYERLAAERGLAWAQN